jgi:hypothetical protein
VHVREPIPVASDAEVMRQEVVAVASEAIRVSITIKAPAEAIFAVLVDPAKHPAIDGTGWVRDPLDRQPLTASGQIFRMAMYHPNHPTGNYEMANLLTAEGQLRHRAT